MPGNKKIRVVIDTNLFISFLIGKKLNWLKGPIVNFQIELLFTEQSFLELEEVARRPKFTKYFPKSDLNDLIDLLRKIGKQYMINEVINVCRDPKDNFLLELARKGKADFLLTGDDDLLELGNYQNTKILTAGQFEQVFKTYIKS